MASVIKCLLVFIHQLLTVHAGWTGGHCAAGGGSLQIQSLYEHELSLVYRVSSGGGGTEVGVHITNLLSSKGSLLIITSLEGEEIVYRRHSIPASSALLRLMGHSFLARWPLGTKPLATLKSTPIKGSETAYQKNVDFFALPSEVSGDFDKSLQRHQVPAEFGCYLRTETLNASVDIATSSLLHSPEFHLVIEACHALGGKGVFGYQYPAAMDLYVYIHHLQAMIERIQSDISMAGQTSPSADQTVLEPAHQDFTRDASSSSQATHFSLFDSILSRSASKPTRTYGDGSDIRSSGKGLVGELIPDGDFMERGGAELQNGVKMQTCSPIRFFTESVSRLTVRSGDGGREGGREDDRSLTDSEEIPVCLRLRHLYEQDRESRHLYACRECPLRDDCLGMCGVGCQSCWWFVCGDCCFHQGCYEHDVRCVERGFRDLSCLLPFMRDFSCESYRPDELVKWRGIKQGLQTLVEVPLGMLMGNT